MTESSLDLAARSVLSRYPIGAQRAVLRNLGNRGGFSGARLWQVHLTDAEYMLKAWPHNGIKGERLAWIHQLMRAARGSGLSVVPEVLMNEDGLTCGECAGRIWDLTSLIRGKADYHERPGRKRLQNACLALAELHASWSGLAPATGVCPGVRQRMKRIREWDALRRSAWEPRFSARQPGSLQVWCERAWRLLPPWVDVALGLLAPWAERRLPLQPCLRDVWHDHVFFIGEFVTGIVDFGSVKIDHVAVDLARLLGSMVEDDAQLRAAGLEAYGYVHPLSEEEQALVGVLDKTGTILALMNWLKWLYHDDREFEDLCAAAQRIERLVKRVARWGGP